MDEALDNGYEVLHLEPEPIKRMEALGYKRAVIPRVKYRELKEDVRTIDFSGWPLITHRWLTDDLAYAICEAIDAQKDTIRVDDNSPLDIKKWFLCSLGT